MANTEFWLFSRPAIGTIEKTAQQAEDQGWDGLALTDSQNLSPDTYVALTLAAKATTRLKLGPGVTNPVTRHAAVTAGTIASIQELSGGRAMLGIGRGDSALFNIGYEPLAPKLFEQYVSDLQNYLRGDVIDKNGYASKLHWLNLDSASKVPVDLAATGPKVIAIGARHADRVSFSVGADPERVRWAQDQLKQSLPEGKALPSTGLYLNVCVSDDIEQAAEMIRGGVGTFAHFTGMKGASKERVPVSDQAVYQNLGEAYDRPKHGRADASHAQQLPLEFVQRFAVIGPPEHCQERLQTLIDTGIERLFIIGPRPDHFGAAAETAIARFATEVMPRLHS